MKSVIVVAAFSAATIALQGCGGGGTTTTTTPIITSTAATSPSVEPVASSTTTASTGSVPSGGSTSTSAPCAYDHETKWECPTTVSKTSFQDMKDGDTKDVELANGVLTISDPAGAWTTQLFLDPHTCAGQVNFTVDGKPNPPPGNLTLAMLSSLGSESSCTSPSNYVLSFSDVGDEGYTPVNQWVAPTNTQVSGTNFTCFPTDQASRNVFFIDVKAGDQKIVKTDCTSTGCSVEISPKTGDDWSMTANIDVATCSGMVDGTKAGMAASLSMSFRVSRWFDQTILMDADDSPLEYFIEFSDPNSGAQVNQWVELGNPDVLPTTTTLEPTAVVA